MKAIHQVFLIVIVAICALSFIPGTYAQFTMNTSVKHTIFSTANIFPDKSGCSKNNKVTIEKPDKKSIRFHIECIDKKYKHLHYALIYDTDSVTREVGGEYEGLSKNYVSKVLVLGSCSSEEVCIYDRHVHTLHLTVFLTEENGKSMKIEETISFMQ